MIAERPSKLRVLRLTPWFYYPPPTPDGWPMRFDPIGGMGTQIHAITRELAKAGIDQTVLTLGMPGAPRRWRPYPNVRVVAVRVPWPPIRSRITGTLGLVCSWAMGAAAWCAVHASRPRRQEFDVIHAHLDGSIYTYVVALTARRLLGKPIVLTVSDSRLATYESPYGVGKVIGEQGDRLELRAFRQADFVHFVTERTRNFHLDRGYVSEDKSAVIGDVVDCLAMEERSRPEHVGRLKSRFALDRGVKYVGFVGRLSFEKGWPTFVEAAALLRGLRHDTRFVVTDGIQRPEFEAMVRQLGLTKDFTRTGFVEHHDMAPLIAAMDVVVYPSTYEELGCLLLEVMAVGRPIVASSVGGIPEVLENGRLGLLVPPRDAAALAVAVEAVLDDPEAAGRRAAAARERVRRDYDIGKAIGEYIRIYDRVSLAESSLTQLPRGDRCRRRTIERT